MNIRDLLREITTLIHTNRQKGQTRRLVDQASRDGVLLVVADHAQAVRIGSSSGSQTLQVISMLQIPTKTVGKDYAGGVVFDNHAVYTLAVHADALIERLEDQILQLQKDKSRLEQDLERERAKAQALLDRLEEFTGEEDVRQCPLCGVVLDPDEISCVCYAR